MLKLTISAICCGGMGLLYAKYCFTLRKKGTLINSMNINNFENMLINPGRNIPSKNRKKHVLIDLP